MHKSLIYSLLVATLYLLEATHAKAVFAHYMVIFYVCQVHFSIDLLILMQRLALLQKPMCKKTLTMP